MQNGRPTVAEVAGVSGEDAEMWDADVRAQVADAIDPILVHLATERLAHERAAEAIIEAQAVLEQALAPPAPAKAKAPPRRKRGGAKRARVPHDERRRQIIELLQSTDSPVSVAEIAKRTGANEATVRSHMNEVEQQLDESLLEVVRGSGNNPTRYRGRTTLPV